MRRPLMLLAAAVMTVPLLAACGSSGGGEVASNPATPGPANCPATGGVPAFDSTWGSAPETPAGVGKAPATLETADCRVGTGAEVADTATPYNWNYSGTFYKDGKVFDTSLGKAPVPFALNQVIPGWTEGLQGMKVGGRRLLVIPADKAYGAAGSPPAIGPNEPLVFVVDLLGPATATQ